jgi:hypothetical protein
VFDKFLISQVAGRFSAGFNKTALRATKKCHNRFLFHGGPKQAGLFDPAFFVRFYRVEPRLGGVRTKAGGKMLLSLD